MKVKVEFSDSDGTWYEVLTLMSIAKLSYAANSKIIEFHLGTGLFDCNGTEIFVGDKFRYYTTKVKQEDNSLKPLWIEGKLESISDMYGSPFRAGKRCEILKD